MHVTLDEEYRETVLAEILSSPERRNWAVRFVIKSDPVISVTTVAPASPSSGSILLIEGFAEDAAVVVATADEVVVLAVARAVVTAVVTVVGAAVGTDSTVTCLIFIIYTFSITARVVFSVAGLVRYPYDPSVFL